MQGRGTNNNGRDENGDDDGSQSPPSSMTADRYEQPSTTDPNSEQKNLPNLGTTSDVSGYSGSSGDVEMITPMDTGVNSNSQTDEQSATNRERSNNSTSLERSSSATPRTVKIPFAIAKLYKLPLTKPPFQPGKPGKKGRWQRKRSVKTDSPTTSPLLHSEGAEKDDESSIASAASSVDGSSEAPYVIPDGEYTPAQKRKIVEAILPSNGATIVKQPKRDKNDRYGIIGSNGVLKRVLFVDRSNGKVYEEMDDDEDDEEGRFSNTIKLGLVSFLLHFVKYMLHNYISCLPFIYSFQGDFIFYSVLVAKSAEYSFPCFISSFLVILAGLGGTLVLLAVYKHALPALPISIFLAVGFYILVRFVAEPWIHVVMNTPFYV